MSINNNAHNSSTDYILSRVKLHSIPSPTNLSFDKSRKTLTKHEIRRVLEICVQIIRPSGIYSTIEMNSAGLQYTREGDAAYCRACNLTLSGWTINIRPFARHAQERPDCTFVKSMRSNHMTILSSNLMQKSIDDESFLDQKKMEVDGDILSLRPLFEMERINQLRKRTFTQWPISTNPSAEEMIEAGFFSCNTGDRVICLYCNLICHQWVHCTDNPLEVHKNLSPHCCFVLAVQNKIQTSSNSTFNESNENDQRSQNQDNGSFRSKSIDFNQAYHQKYIDQDRRKATFSIWPNDLTSIDAYVSAGFFYYGKKCIVTCFFCNGSLQGWNVNDNPMIEHARWFPDCHYAREQVGNVLFQRIQETKRAELKRDQPNNADRRVIARKKCDSFTSYDLPSENTLSDLVTSRLDLPMSRQLLNKPFERSIIKRCWEDQFRLKHDDFTTFSDLLIACMVLQKQINLIQAKKANIVIPSVAMNLLRGYKPIELSFTVSTIIVEDETLTSSESELEVKQPSKRRKTDVSETYRCSHCYGSQPPCAFIPCGHPAACISCANSFRCCPTCQTPIDSFVRLSF